MKQSKYKTPKEKAVYRLFDACRTASRRPKKVRKGIDYSNITYESLYALMETQGWKCIETGIPFVIMDNGYKVEERNRLGINSLNLPSVDRIDNNRGYTMDNIQIVSLAYNNLKNRYDERFVKEWIGLIKLDNNDKSN